VDRQSISFWSTTLFRRAIYKILKRIFPLTPKPWPFYFACRHQNQPRHPTGFAGLLIYGAYAFLDTRSKARAVSEENNPGGTIAGERRLLRAKLVSDKPNHHKLFGQLIGLYQKVW